MCFVKAVVSKFFQLIPEFFHHFPIGAAVFYTAFDKVGFYYLHQGGYFLADSFSQGVSLAAAETAQVLADLHELLLINQDSIGFL